jgi:predicted NUDIX family phosphoesterase
MSDTINPINTPATSVTAPISDVVTILPTPVIELPVPTTIDGAGSADLALAQGTTQPDNVLGAPVVVIDDTESGVITEIPQEPTDEQVAARASSFPDSEYPDGWYWAFNGDTNKTTLVHLYQPEPGDDGVLIPRGLGFNAKDGGGFAPLGYLNTSVILRPAFDPKGHHNKECLVINASQANEPIEQWSPILSNRLIAETNRGTLQVIPYVALINEDGKVATYLRGMSGGEGRLHQKLSIGWGGHIDNSVSTTLTDLIVDETKRELLEEAGMDSADLGDRILAAMKTSVKLYSDAKDVDAVHLGIGIALRVRTEELKGFEEDVITQVFWNTPEELQDIVDGKTTDDGVTREFETWSKIMIGYIKHLSDIQKAFAPI